MDRVDEGRTSKREGRSRVWLWVVVGVIALGIMILAQVFLRDTGNSESAENYTQQAQRACQAAVREELDDNTAQFSDETVEVTGSETPTFAYAVTGTVKGHDANGSELTTTYTCDATYAVGTAQTSAKATIKS